MEDENFFKYTVQITQNFKKYIESLARESSDHLVFYMELAKDSVNLYLKNDITFLYTIITLKHLTKNSLSEVTLEEHLPKNIFCLDMNDFVDSISLISPNMDFNLIYDIQLQELKIWQKGKIDSFEEFEFNITCLETRLTLEELGNELKPIRMAKHKVHQVTFANAESLRKLLEGFALTKKQYIAMSFRDTRDFLQLETIKFEGAPSEGHDTKSVINVIDGKVKIDMIDTSTISRVDYSIKYLNIGAKVMEKSQQLVLTVWSDGYLQFNLKLSGCDINYYIPSKNYEFQREDFEDQMSGVDQEDDGIFL